MVAFIAGYFQEGAQNNQVRFFLSSSQQDDKCMFVYVLESLHEQLFLFYNHNKHLYIFSFLIYWFVAVVVL